VARALPLAAALIPVRPGGQILLQLRDDRPGLPGANRWSTIGGAVENGETPEEAACREAEEEIGQSPGELVPVGTIDGTRFRSHCFATRASWALDDLIAGEGQGVDWLTPEMVRTVPLAKGVEAAVLEFLDSSTYRKLAAGSPAAPPIALPPLQPAFARELGLRPGRLVAAAGASAAFIRRLWDVLGGARVTTSMGEDEQADVVLWWPRATFGADALAGWRSRLAPGGALWCVAPAAAADGGDKLAAVAKGLGLMAAAELVLPSGERALRLDAVARE
jgi:8-oxo-dGTP diphosphatase